MRLFKLFLCTALILSLCACGRSEFTDLSGFVDGYNSYTGEETLSITAFSFNKSKGTPEYTALPYGEDSPLMISLYTDTTQKIRSMRIFLRKADENGEPITPSDEVASRFFLMLQASVKGFCLFTDDEIALLVAELFPSGKADLTKYGEITKISGRFHFAFYSTDISCELRITNTYLQEVPSTKKPVSRPYFADSEVTRESANPRP